MNHRKFYQNFCTEKDCIIHLKTILEKKKITCPKCNLENPKWNEKQLLWRCKCTMKISVKSLTFMRDSNIPLLKWFEAIFLFTNTKKPSSDKEIAKAIEIKRYKTVHYLVLKIRKAMSKNLEQISFDSFFQYDEKKDNTCKLLIEKSKSRKIDKIRLVLPKDKNKVFSFMKSPTYHMKKIVITEVKEPNKLEHIQWIQNQWRMTISKNFKVIIDGIHHYITKFHEQLYLDEYSYKYNKRYSKNRFEDFLDECLLA